MSDYTSSLSSGTFAPTIRKFCSEHGWDIFRIGGELAALKFEGNAGTEYTVIIFLFEGTLNFSVATEARFASEAVIPRQLCTWLLCRSSGMKVGFWAIKDKNDEFVVTRMHTVESRFVDSEHFGIVVRHLIKSCDEFEAELEDIG